ncbi:MAG: hypothetical protein AAGB51_00490 [Planctomycetota bacterium]
MKPAALGLALLALASAILAACSSPDPKGPASVILRNSTPHTLELLVIEELTKNPDEPIRMGRWQGVPANTDEFVARRRPELEVPMEVAVRWKIAGRTGIRTQRVLIPSSLRNGSPKPGEALVFEVLPEGRVRVVSDTPRAR